MNRLRSLSAETLLFGALIAIFVVIVAIFVVTGLTATTSDVGNTGGAGIRYQHDDARGVGCWMIGTAGIDCLADSEYR